MMELSVHGSRKEGTHLNGNGKKLVTGCTLQHTSLLEKKLLGDHFWIPKRQRNRTEWNRITKRVTQTFRPSEENFQQTKELKCIHNWTSEEKTAGNYLPSFESYEKKDFFPSLMVFFFRPVRNDSSSRFSSTNKWKQRMLLVPVGVA